MSDDTAQAIATLTAYAASCHDEIARADARLVAAYAELLSLWTSQTVQRAKAEMENERLRAALRRWWRTDETPDFPGAEAALEALCWELFETPREE